MTAKRRRKSARRLEEWVECPQCKGLGETFREDGSTEKCPNCRGSGMVNKDSSEE